jgi:predicted O-linked N-acetylglucosamine transferase (SPINDLY family)
LRKALDIRSDPGVEVRLAMLLPTVLNSSFEAKKAWEETTKKLDLLEKGGIVLEDPHKEVGITSFLFAYHGVNDLNIQRRLAAFYTKAYPELVETSYHNARNKPIQNKINIAFVSKHFFSHTVAELYRGIIKHLPRDRFTVTLFRFPGREDHMAKQINRTADTVVTLPADLTRARNRIAEHSPDIIFYPDIGMDSLTYFLAFSRLAPVQCVGWGHPVTTGLPNIDYFLSLNDAEPNNGQDHYTEHLIRLESVGTYFYRPSLPENPSSRNVLGLPEQHNIYACPQSLFKFHPDFDEILGQILRRDSHGRIVLIDGRIQHWSHLLQKRFESSIPDVVDRIRFIPQMSHADFLSFLLQADVILDTIYFGGGKTSLEAFACGQPVVTLPGDFLRGRLTLAFYKQMGIMDCVANDTASYVDIAFTLANDKSWKKALTDKLQERSDVLYENDQVIDELAWFFQQAMEKKPL